MPAAALGGTIGRNPPGPAVGLYAVSLTDAGRLDPLLAGSEGSPAMIGTTTSSPAARGHPASPPPRTGPCRRRGSASAPGALQFHPEVSAGILAAWFASETGSIRDPDGSVVAQVAAAEPELRRAWQPLADRFTAIITDGIQPTSPANSPTAPATRTSPPRMAVAGPAARTGHTRPSRSRA